MPRGIGLRGQVVAPACSLGGAKSRWQRHRVRLASPLKGRPGSGGPKRLAGRPSPARRPPQHRRMPGVIAALLLIVASALAPAAARADAQPAILKAYGLDWIERVRDDAWPQPKAQRPVICLLDTGVAITPDTPADNPEGPIVARLSVEDPLPGSEGAQDAESTEGLGLPQGASFAHLHGTRMAALIGAARNGYGTVGIFPQARIISVRVTEQADVHITPANVLLGVRLCRIWAHSANARPAAIVLAESLYDQRPQEVARWQSAASIAAAIGAPFFAASGNSIGAAPVAPAGVPGVIVVGGGDDEGRPCADFSLAASSFDAIGPGCSKLAPGLWPGTSSATAAVGALAAVIATRSPGLAASELETEMRQVANPRSFDARRLLARFEAYVVSEAPSTPQPPELVVSRDDAKAAADVAVRLWKPSIRVSRSGSRVKVVRTSHRAGVLRARWVGAPGALRLRGQKASFRVPKRVSRIEIWAESADGVSWRSLSLRVRVR